MKQNIKIILATLLIIINGALYAHEIKYIREVLGYLKGKRTLVVFDIDNTLLHPPTDLGSDQWFSHLVQEQFMQGNDLTAAIQHVVPLYCHVHYEIDLITTEANLSHDIACIQNHCDYAICLTSRSLPLAQRTVEQLAKNDLYFHNCDHTPCTLTTTHPSLYKDGILFCGLNDKGDVLKAFLDSIKYYPEMIIFVDDKEKYIHSVQTTVHSKNIEYIGLRYSGCDHRVQAFNKESTEKEFREFLIRCPFYIRSAQ